MAEEADEAEKAGDATGSARILRTIRKRREKRKETGAGKRWRTGLERAFYEDNERGGEGTPKGMEEY